MTGAWEPVIGIEVHVELQTQSKMFCGCEVSYGAEANTKTCPTCLGLPGALPVANSVALDWIIRIGLALHCEVSERSVFHRKNYFYADLPKNYQVSQFDLPVCRGGWLDVTVGEQTRRIGIERAHMEEDTGKSLHQGNGGRIHSATSTLLDFNRSGVPLVEIVSRPDLRSAAEARAYAQGLRNLVAELGVSDARMEAGSIRFDANVSVRREGATELGTKVEIKNMNSFRSLERAIAFEIHRQVALLDNRQMVKQETRHWDEESGTTVSMRSKEESSDYRYFAEPDLLPLVFGRELVDRLRADLPELPADRRMRLENLGIAPHTARALAIAEPELRRTFEEAVALGAKPVSAANWVAGELTATIRRLDAPVAIGGSALLGLIAMTEDGRLSSSAAKDVLVEMLRSGDNADVVASRLDLIQISDVSAIEETVAEVLAAEVGAVERYRSGEEKVIGFLVGLVMKKTGGKADPQIVNQILRRHLA
ncbi:MAG TPA: Asp-tRNA(Asn)/Glu-tRNA(Gln) amidotransferase subunit GatB [Acidimicrobiia bacterium]|jgi:aspartyl-tRNA(Asn)/glutamyl-tRNA(Gln) amidotransferase subunit B|nr:Asp-tRNA(Asn)/Glu-tRNA(Gln) amidotransferase subunit GatB [Acidimicrobiia bacterium]